MPRQARLIFTGLPHHITQRGNYQQTVFESNQDYSRYCYWYEKYSRKYCLETLAFCLMPNHVHFICIPKKENSLALTFNTIHMRYAQYFNKKHSRIGHLWQGRFFSCVLDEPHLFSAWGYVETNPVRARLVKNSGDWKWSSVRHQLSGKTRDFFGSNLKEGKRLVNEVPFKKEIEEIRRHTISGRPLGDDDFIKKLEKISGTSLRPNPVGRPSKNRIISGR